MTGRHCSECILISSPGQLAGSHLLEHGLIVSVSQPGQTKFVGSPNALYQFSAKEGERYAVQHGVAYRLLLTLLI